MNKLQELRTAAGLTRQQLSIKSGVNIRTIEAYEQGNKDINKAKLITILKLCSSLNCNLHDVITDDEILALLKELKLG